MPAAFAPSGAGGDDALDVAVEGDAVAMLPHRLAEVFGNVHIVEQQHRALRRRPPFQRRHMRQRIEAAAIGRQQRVQRQLAMHQTGQARRVVERALRVGQGIIRRQQFLEVDFGKAGQRAEPRGLERPGRGKCPAFRHIERGFAKQRRAAVGRGGIYRRRRPMVGGSGQEKSLERALKCGNGEILGSYVSRWG
jgi:hypothetical protein